MFFSIKYKETQENNNIFAKINFANILLKNKYDCGRMIAKGGKVKWKRYQLLKKNIVL